jgi:NAD(P)H-hydrate repair Nnr-like enzyme with NAD(P)H-hydrate dehydratase domain
VPPLHLLNAASVLDTSNVVYPIMCESDEDAVPWAAFLGSVVMKTASRMAYNDKGRAMTSPDVLSYIGRAFASLHEH